MRLQNSSWTSDLIPLHASTLQNLEKDVQGGLEFSFSGTSKDGRRGWLTQGRVLEVFSVSSGDRIAAWSFGSALKEPNTTITCIQEYHYEKKASLLVATSSSSSEGGLICLFDIASSKVIKAVEVPYKVTALEPVATVGDSRIPKDILSQQLCSLCGVVAVGTNCGHIYLIDLCLDDEGGDSDELLPDIITFLDPSYPDIQSKRYHAVSQGHHLCIELGEDNHNHGLYYYRRVDGTLVNTYKAEDICVSSLKLIPQIGLLAVGFNFGCFQLWRLQIPVLDHSSRLDNSLPPVVSFAYQEPENDPRNFCYLWVARGPLPGEQLDCSSSVTLMQLCYNRKIWHEGFGYIFEELTSVGFRFEHLLTSNPFTVSDSPGVGTRIINCYTLEDPTYHAPVRTGSEDSFEDGSSGNDLSLCLFVWEAVSSNAEAKPAVYMGLFDMNRWYHAQMPVTLRCLSSNYDVCAFFAFCTLDRVMEASEPSEIRAVHLGYKSITKFVSPACPAPEQHFYPSSLSFEVKCVVSSGIVCSKFLGVQKKALADIQEIGPACLQDPNAVYNLCQYAAVLPRNLDLSNTTFSSAEKRDAILSAALDHHQVGFITTCISQGSQRELVDSGFTMRSILDWAWKKVAQIKESLDLICVPLYDWSGDPFDQPTIQMLHSYSSALAHLIAVFDKLLSQAMPTTEQGKRDLESKLKVVTLISQHLNIVLWFYQTGLLPEHSVEEVLRAGEYAYPAKLLQDSYTKRRAAVHRLHSELRSFEILMIDGLVEDVGDPLKNLWIKEGGTSAYPPSSLHALLNMYLLDGVDMNTKHSIVLYLLCDLFNLIPEGKLQIEFNEKLHQFGHALSLPRSLTNFVRAMWLLDHCEFEDALLYLLDAGRKANIRPWQHTMIIKAFLYQGQHKLALKYIRIRDPPLTTPEDVKLKLTVMLSNGLISEAFDYQRMCRDQLSADDLLCHLFQGSQQTKTVDQLLQLPFTKDEEQHLVKYLRNNSDPRAQELLVVYYLQRGRFVDGIRLNAKLQQTLLSDTDPKVRERVVTRNHIVDGYQRVLPSVQRKLAFGPELPVQRRQRTKCEFVRPTPLSTVVRDCKTKPTTRSQMLKLVLEKVHEVNSANEVEPGALPSSTSTSAYDETGPFICTPLTQTTRTTVRDTQVVVYPKWDSQTEAGLYGASPLTPKSSNRRRLSGTPMSFTTESGRPTDPRQSFRRDVTYQSAGALSLLQTPPVKHKLPARLQRPSAPSTPQSILKDRTKSIRRSPSPMRELDKLRSMSKVMMATPPRPTRRTLGALERIELEATPSSESAQSTPKLLRFQEPEESPGFEIDTQQTEEEEYVHSPLKDVRDRSPTPERQSPKQAEMTEIVYPSRNHLEDQSDEDMESEEEEDDVEMSNSNSVCPSEESKLQDEDQADMANSENIQTVPVDTAAQAAVAMTTDKSAMAEPEELIQTDTKQNEVRVSFSDVTTESKYSLPRINIKTYLTEESVGSSYVRKLVQRIENKEPMSVEDDSSPRSSSPESNRDGSPDDINQEIDNIFTEDANEMQDSDQRKLDIDEQYDDSVEEISEDDVELDNGPLTLSSSDENGHASSPENLTSTIKNTVSSNATLNNLIKTSEHIPDKSVIIENNRDDDAVVVGEEICFSGESSQKSDSDPALPNSGTHFTDHKNDTECAVDSKGTSNDDLAIIEDKTKPIDIIDNLTFSLETEKDDGKKDEPVEQEKNNLDHQQGDINRISPRSETGSDIGSLPDGTANKTKTTPTRRKKAADLSLTPRRSGRLLQKTVDALDSPPQNTRSKKKLTLQQVRTEKLLEESLAALDDPSTTKRNLEGLTLAQQRTALSLEESVVALDKPIVDKEGNISFGTARRSGRKVHQMLSEIPESYKPESASYTVDRNNDSSHLKPTDTHSVSYNLRAHSRSTRSSSPMSGDEAPAAGTTPNKLSALDKTTSPARPRSTKSPTRGEPKQAKSPSRPKPTPSKSPSRSTTSPGRSARGQRSTRRTDSISSTDSKPESDKMTVEDGMGPLSDGSFMMQLRSGRRVSTDQSPTSHNQEPQEPPSFEFSDPVIVDSMEGTDDSAWNTNPVHPFIFSPPVTRSRRRRESLLAEATPLPSQLRQSPSRSLPPPKSPGHRLLEMDSPAKSPSRTRNTPRKSLKLQETPKGRTPVEIAESPINFLSPLPEEDNKTSEATRKPAVVKRVPSYSLRIRPAKATVAKRKPLKW